MWRPHHRLSQCGQDWNWSLGWSKQQPGVLCVLTSRSSRTPPPVYPINAYLQVEYIRVTTFNNSTVDGVVAAMKEGKVGREERDERERGRVRVRGNVVHLTAGGGWCCISSHAKACLEPPGPLQVFSAASSRGLCPLHVLAHARAPNTHRRRVWTASSWTCETTAAAHSPPACRWVRGAHMGSYGVT